MVLWLGVEKPLHAVAESGGLYWGPESTQSSLELACYFLRGVDEPGPDHDMSVYHNHHQLLPYVQCSTAHASADQINTTFLVNGVVVAPKESSGRPRVMCQLVDEIFQRLCGRDEETEEGHRATRTSIGSCSHQCRNVADSMDANHPSMGLLGGARSNSTQLGGSNISETPASRSSASVEGFPSLAADRQVLVTDSLVPVKSIGERLASGSPFAAK